MPNSLMSTVDWSKFEYYKPEDFKHPEKLDREVVYGLERVAGVLGVKAIILSDYRVVSDISKSQHGLGKAIDFTYPGVDSVVVLDTIRDINCFSGYGLYVNEQTLGVSFHVDTRVDRTPESPATWGATKDRRTGQVAWAYTSLRSIIDKFFPATMTTLLWVSLAGVALYYLTKRT